MNIEVIPPKFDIDGLYAHELRLALKNARLSDHDKLTKLKTVVQRAYEQGVMDAKQDKTYFDDF